jgi:hypothetical protein
MAGICPADNKHQFKYMHKRIFSVLFFVSVVLNLHAQSVSQKIVVNKGQVFETVSHMTTSMAQEMMGQKVDFKMDHKTTRITEVKDINPDAYHLTNTIKRIVMHTNAMGQDINFDSDKPEDMYGEMGQRVKGIVNAESKVTVDKTGKIVELNMNDSTENDMMSKMMSMSANMSKGASYPLFSVLPAKAVKPGDSWTDSISTSEGMKITNINTYTFRGVSGNEITVDIAGKLTQEGTTEQQGMSIGMNMTGTSKGESVYDQKTGILKRDTLNTDMQGTMEVMGQSVPVTMKITMENEVKKRL